ncbi:MAG: Cro/Cl family transcriptional regulator [Mesorhizobium sp.]|nr:MAG: Cro/Cl family transcriptional regulator [Mesorhizobium sp.]
MNTKDVVKAVGGMQALCDLLQCGRSSVYQWGALVPESRQYELEVKTDGKLLSDYSISRQALSAGASHE